MVISCIYTFIYINVHSWALSCCFSCTRVVRVCAHCEVCEYLWLLVYVMCDLERFSFEQSTRLCTWCEHKLPKVVLWDWACITYYKKSNCRQSPKCCGNYCKLRSLLKVFWHRGVILRTRTWLAAAKACQTATLMKDQSFQVRLVSRELRHLWRRR